MGAGGTGRKGSGVPGLWAGTSPLLLYQGLRGGVLWWIPDWVSHRGCLCEPGWLVPFVLFLASFLNQASFGNASLSVTTARWPGLGLSDPGPGQGLGQESFRVQKLQDGSDRGRQACSKDGTSIALQALALAQGSGRAEHHSIRGLLKGPVLTWPSCRLLWEGLH